MPVETAQNGGFPHLTPSNGGSSVTFGEGPGEFLAISNLFTINSMDCKLVKDHYMEVWTIVKILLAAVTNRQIDHM